MGFTYTDYGKTMLHTWGRFRVTIEEAVVAGDLLSFFNEDNDYTVELANESASQQADCIACEDGAAHAEIWACLKAECKASYSVGTGGVVTQNNFAASADFFGAPLYLSGTDGQPSSDEGTTLRQVVGKLLARDRILLDIAPTSVGAIAETFTAVGNLTALSMTITDASVLTGAHRGIYLAYTCSGASITGWVMGMDITLTITGSGSGAYLIPLSVGVTVSTMSGTAGQIFGIFIWMGSFSGETITTYYGISVNMYNDGTCSDTCFIYMRSHSGLVDACLSIKVGSADFLLKFDGIDKPLEMDATVGSQVGRIRIEVGGTAYFMPYYAT